MRDYFIEQGLYYDSKAYGGTYTPQVGDIYFKGVPTDASHVGYVVSVESGVFWVVDGNCNNSVRNHYEALTSSDVLGFAHPNYVTSGHTASEYEVDSTTHSGTCNNCGCEFEEEHYGGNTYYTSTTQHWKICEICDSVFGKVAHTMVRVGSTSTEKCSVCGYTGVNAVV